MLLFLFLSVFFLFGCGSQEPEVKPEFQYSGMTMGTTFSVKITRLPDTVKPPQLQTVIDRILTRVNAQMSTYLENSELSTVNQSASTDWLACSDSLFQVITEAQRISELSNGAFDITVGPLVNLWGFGPHDKAGQQPASADIESGLQRVGYKKLKIRQIPPAIKKQLPNLYIDLSALAKGYGVDQVADFLEALEVSHYMVEVGGELRVKGKNPKEEFWRIAIEKPNPGQRSVQSILSLKNIAIATSGDYRNFFESDGQRFSHTIDPRTGYPVKHELASVTVLNEKAMTADAVATAMMVLGVEAGYTLAEEQQWAVFFIAREEGKLITKETSAFTEISQ